MPKTTVAPQSQTPANQTDKPKSALDQSKTKKQKPKQVINPASELEGLKQTTAGGLLERQFSPRETVLDPRLRSEETCIIWAATGVGETMLAATSEGGTEALWGTVEPNCLTAADMATLNKEAVSEGAQRLVERLSKNSDDGHITPI